LKRFGISLFLFAIMCLPGAMGFAQTPSSGAQPQIAQGDSHLGTASQGVDTVEQESGDDVYRHSASVRLLGRWLHLDKETAARLFEYLNFAIMGGAVLFALLKYLPKTFRENREKIQHDLVDARTATEQAHERLAAIEQRLGHLDAEIAAISKQAEKDGVEDEARIKASIETERQRIVESINKDIAAAASAAQRDLKQFAAGLAVDRALQRLTLTADEDRALLSEFVEELAQGRSRQTQGRGENN
jgi:F-type H+-transporting ATPase subunit b